MVGGASRPGALDLGRLGASGLHALTQERPAGTPGWGRRGKCAPVSAEPRRPEPVKSFRSGLLILQYGAVHGAAKLTQSSKAAAILPPLSSPASPLAQSRVAAATAAVIPAAHPHWSCSLSRSREQRQGSAACAPERACQHGPLPSRGGIRGPAHPSYKQGRGRPRSPLTPTRLRSRAAVVGQLEPIREREKMELSRTWTLPREGGAAEYAADWTREGTVGLKS